MSVLKIQGCSIHTDCYWLGNVVLFNPKNEMFLFLINPHSSWKVFRSFNIVNIEKYEGYLNKGKLICQHENSDFLLRTKPKLKHLWQQLQPPGFLSMMPQAWHSWIWGYSASLPILSSSVKLNRHCHFHVRSEMFD